MEKIKFTFFRTFSSVRNYRNYRLFFLGQLISVAGTWMQTAAMAWLILVLTHSAFMVGLLAVALYGPYTLFGLFGGVFADRLDNRRAVIGAQGLEMLAAAGLAVLALSGLITPWELFLFAAIAGSAMVIDTPARQALTYQMVGRKELANAVALNSTIYNIGRIAGPALAGVMLAAFSPGWCFVVNTVSFLAVLSGLMLMDPKELHPLNRHEQRPKLMKGLAAGARFVFANPRILALASMITVFSILCFNFAILLPVLAKVTLHSGPQVYGIISASFGVGALVGALLAAGLAKASLRIMAIGGIGFAACQFALAPLHSILFVAILLFFSGVFFTIYMASSDTVIQLEAPDYIRGRVLGIYNWGWLGVAPLGGVLTGWFCVWGGTALAFYVAGGAGIALIGGGYLYLRAQRTITHRTEETAKEPTRYNQVAEIFN